MSMVATALMVVLCFQPVSATASSTVSGPAFQWSKYHYDMGNTGFNPRETILSPSTVGDLAVSGCSPCRTS